MISTSVLIPFPNKLRGSVKPCWYKYTIEPACPSGSGLVHERSRVSYCANSANGGIVSNAITGANANASNHLYLRLRYQINAQTTKTKIQAERSNVAKSATAKISASGHVNHLFQ